MLSTEKLPNDNKLSGLLLKSYFPSCVGLISGQIVQRKICKCIKTMRSYSGCCPDQEKFWLNTSITKASGVGIAFTARNITNFFFWRIISKTCRDPYLAYLDLPINVKWVPIHLVTQSLVRRNLLRRFVILLVFLNTCCVAVEHYNQPQWLTEFLGKPYHIRSFIKAISSFFLSIFKMLCKFQKLPSTCFSVCSWRRCLCGSTLWDQGYFLNLLLTGKPTFHWLTTYC